MEGNITIMFNTGGQAIQKALPGDICTIGALNEFARHIGQQSTQDLIITDGHKDITCDADVQQLQPGQRLLVWAGQQDDQSVFKERVTFNPHPKTLTMAGDYEYFAAQGHHPLAFALAELIDNALRATKGNQQQPRSITVSLVTDSKGQNGMLCVRDNGSGMTVQELNDWAVMNLSMEDRGLLNTDEPKCGSRFLSSDISYFGVGSKNAAFYLGGTVKVVTKANDSSYVHELCIQAAELERRYREGQAVYEEEMTHRQPGATSSLAAFEQVFPLAQQMLEQEVPPVAGQAANNSSNSAPSSFTRVLIYALKPDVLAQLCDVEQGRNILRDLAHLYHYYLHGAQGNNGSTALVDQLPNGEKVPDILLERWQGSHECWRKTLVDVDDDLESRYLAAQRASLDFVLSVPNHGKVEGILWYFPFENDQETVPLDAHTLGRMMLTSHRQGPDGATQRRPEGATQQPGVGGGLAAVMTQQGATQMAAWQIQAAKQDEIERQEEAGRTALMASCPTFEAFWQGRLIPGACVDTLPFIRAVHLKRTAADKDRLPDEVFSRIRGALFFGPGFRVTRNKLTFRDNLALLLESASPADRQLEKHFKQWLDSCHHQLDRSVRFEGLSHQSEQASARKEHGQDITLFERINDGMQTIQKGDIIKLSTRPAILGRVLFFSISQAVQHEGCYSGGRVTVCALPPELLGADSRHTWPLRRVEGLVSQEELHEHVDRELGKLPALLRLEPMNLATGGVKALLAGSKLPETNISVLNGSGNKVVKARMGGKRQQLKVVQTLYYLGPANSGRKRTAAATAASAQPTDDGTGTSGTAAAEKGASKRSKRRKKVDAAGDDKENDLAPGTAVQGAAGTSKKGAGTSEVMQDDPMPEGEVVFTTENKSPLQECFQFQRIAGGLTRAGYYCLQYSLLPELPDGRQPRFSIDLEVVAGPSVAFDIRGEGRAVAMSKAVVLGESLPPLRLTFLDAHGNVVPAQADEPKSVQLQVLQGSLSEGGAVLQELQVQAQMDQQQDELWISNLHLAGQANCTADSGGMQLFKPKQAASDPSGRRLSQANGPSAGLPLIRAVDVFVAAHVEGLPPQGFPVRVLPGAPHCLQLLDGHPFCQQAQTGKQQQQQAPTTDISATQDIIPAQVISGELLPTFKVRSLDAWGNPTCPRDELLFEVVLQCAAADPAEGRFTVDDRGVATINGMCLCRHDTQGSQDSQRPSPDEADAQQQLHQLTLQPMCSTGDLQPAMQIAMELAQPQQQMVLPVVVLPSTMPAVLKMTHQGQALGQRTEKPSADNPEGGTVWQLAGIEAGSVIEGLEVQCVDEVGRPAASTVQGKFTVSWANGCKKAKLSGHAVKLPPLQAPDATGEAVPFWVKFTGNQKEWPGLVFDINFEVSIIPGPPASWSVAIVNYDKSAAAGAGKGGDADGNGDLSNIPCGKPFYLEIEALDACNNRCCFDIDAKRPKPVVVAEPEDPEVQLQLDPDAWQCKWDHTQAGGDVCQFKLWLAGPPGPVKLIVRDNAGEDGASLLVADELPIELLPGPAAALVADCPQQLECGNKGLLETLPIKVVDSYGNFVDTANFEVALNGSAFNSEGVAARVAAGGSNRAKLRNGIATFKNVRLQADTEGLYKLTIGCVSRKFALKEAVVSVKVAQQNYVCNVEVLENSLPSEGSSTTGCKLQLLVVVDTEDRQVAPWDVIQNSLTLSIAPPDKLSLDAVGANAAAGKPSKNAKGSSMKADIIVLQPDGMFGAEEQKGLQAAVVEEAAAAVSRGCVVVFSTPELVVAGQYTVTAEYRETRPELLLGLAKQDQLVRSTSQQFVLAAGPVSSAVLQAAGADQEEFTVSNGQPKAQRTLLRNAVVQLLDAHGSAVTTPGVAVRWRLLCDSADSCASDAAPPALCSGGGNLQLITDERGRAFFGDLEVEQDSGRLPPGTAQVPCQLEVQVLIPTAKGKRSNKSGGSWVTVWQRPVMFSDDAARVKQLQGLNEQRNQLQQQLAGVTETIQELRQRRIAAQQAHKAACVAAAKQLEVLRQKLRLPDLQLTTVADAQALLQQVKAEAATGASRPALSARYGGPRQPMTLAISKLLQHEDPDLVGVFAQLACVDEPRLSAVLSTNYCAAMQVMVVKTYEAITRLRQAAQGYNIPIPSMLSYTLIQEFVPENAACGGQVVMQHVSDLAQQLQSAACEGTDPPLPIPLPHTRVLSIMANQGRALPGGLLADDWPAGCLGFAVNLVRPAIRNSRKGLLNAQLGRTLVFETLNQAAHYRTHVIKVLHSNTADIVTLDGNKLSGRGVVMGSNFKVPSIDEAAFRFGSIPAGQQVLSQSSTTQPEAAAEAIVDLLQRQEEATAELQEVDEIMLQPQHQELERQDEELQQHLKELTRQIKQQQRSIRGGNSRPDQGHGEKEQEHTDGEREQERTRVKREAAEAANAAAEAAAEQQANPKQHRSKRRRG